MGGGNQWNSKYQVSKDNGVTWYYHNGTSWVIAPSAVYTFASSASEINTNFASFNSIGAGTSMKIRAFLNSNGSQKVELDNIEFTTSGAFPNITSYFPWDFKIIPIKNFNFTFDYSDAIWIDTSSDRVELRKWQTSSWWADISSTYINFAGKTVTATNALYPSSNLPYWKYKVDFFIKNILWNESTVSIIFYRDEPEFILSNPSLVINPVITNFSTFSPEYVLTVKTIWAGFRIKMTKNWLLNQWNGITLNDWDETSWVWYDAFPYTWDISVIWVWEVIANQGTDFTIDGEKNTYIYKIKVWVLVDNYLQQAWNYTNTAKFWIEFDY